MRGLLHILAAVFCLLTTTIPSTASHGDVTPPTAPTLNQPATAPPLVTDSTYLTFVWGASTDTGSPDITYRFQVSTSETFAFNIFIDSPGLTETTAQPFIPGTTTYFWRVFASDSEANTETSSPTFVAFQVDTAPPTAFTLTVINGDSRTPPVPLQWTASTGLERYIVQIDTTGTFTGTAFTESASASTDTVYVTLGLPVDTYFYRVTAFDAAGNATACSPAIDSFAVYTSSETQVPATFSLTAPANGFETSVAVLNFSWTESSDSTPPISYRLQIDTAGLFTAATLRFQSSFVADSFVNSVSLVGTETYIWRVQAADVLGNIRASDTRSFYLDTTPPTGPTIVAGDASESSAFATVNLRLGVTSEPFEMQVSDTSTFDGATWIAFASDSNWTFTDSNGTRTLFARFRDRLGNASDTASDTITLRVPPLPVTNLEAGVNSDLSVTLRWARSASTVSSYRVYRNSGGSTALGGSPTDTITATTDSVTYTASTGALTEGTTYLFRVTAVDAGGIEDREKPALRVTIRSPSSTIPSARVTAPVSGSRVARNFTTVRAEISPTSRANEVKSIAFEYRQFSETAATTFANMKSRDAAVSNPITASSGVTIYSFPWDLNGATSGETIAYGTYEIRALATYTDGTQDAAAPISTVVVLDTDATRSESSTSTSTSIRVRVSGVASETVPAPVDDGWSATIFLPAGALSAATYLIVNLIEDDALPAQPSGTNIPARAYHEGKAFDITLASGDTELNDRAVITIQYADANNDGIIDGTTIRAGQALLLAYSPATGEWEVSETFAWLPASKQLRAEFSHFTFFVLAGPGAAVSLDSATVYPNPFVPGDNDATNGVEFDGSAQSGIIFEGLPATVRIRIFTIFGEKIAEFAANTTGTVQWDVRTDRGKPVASGVYIYVIDAGGVRKSGKIAVVR